jgi:hypothetical protein
MIVGNSWSQFENCVKELSPYVKERLAEATSRDMSEIERYLKESYDEDERFRKLINEVFGELWDKVVPSDKRIARKILDSGLWFTIIYQLRRKLRQKIPMSRKFTGRLVEIVVESILRAYLNMEKFSYEFVDCDPVDYTIFHNDDVVCEISCKTVLSTNQKSPYYYDKHADIIVSRLERQKKKFFVFCACAYLKEKEIIRQRFDGIENCRLFYLWDRIEGLTSSAYMLDESFYDFIKFIEKL